MASGELQIPLKPCSPVSSAIALLIIDSYNCSDSSGVKSQSALSYERLVSMPKVVIANEKKEIEVPAGANLREELVKAGVQVYGRVEKYLNCRGLGLCGTCRVLVKKGMDKLGRKACMERFSSNLHP